MPKKIAFMTVGVLLEPMGHPTVQGFMDRIPAVYGAADGSDGFIARSVRDMETLLHSWGPVIAPKCFGDVDFTEAPSTLSMWDDLESVAAFAYHGAHGEAMAKRKEWFKNNDAPSYVAWWVDSDHVLTYQEGADRLDHLHEHGSTPHAFNFIKPFDADGNPCPIKPDKVRAKVGVNASK